MNFAQLLWPFSTFYRNEAPKERTRNWSWKYSFCHISEHKRRLLQPLNSEKQNLSTTKNDRKRVSLLSDVWFDRAMETFRRRNNEDGQDEPEQRRRTSNKEASVENEKTIRTRESSLQPVKKKKPSSCTRSDPFEWKETGFSEPRSDHSPRQLLAGPVNVLKCGFYLHTCTLQLFRGLMMIEVKLRWNWNDEKLALCVALNYLDYRCLSRVINSYEARDLFERVRWIEKAEKKIPEAWSSCLEFPTSKKLLFESIEAFKFTFT